ncbi:MFS general substrate transporter [Mycena pura]|uniref:MFS general substrate transporter n=1 Tax=Mycena pura TaxID=153505 RepID=A0AAD6YMX2_9AGAR|nr:MFS general substrate transporter [Mycena pura]
MATPEPFQPSSTVADSKTESQPSVADDPLTGTAFHEGGFRAWATIAGSWLALFSTFGYTNAFGVYQDYYTRIYLNNTTPSAVSWIGSFQLFVTLLMGFWVGKLFDKGYFHYLMIVGSTLFVFSLFMLSLARPHRYYEAGHCIQALGMGLGLGMVLTPSVSIPSHYFRRRRALAAGIALSGSSVGAIIHPILLNNLFQKEDVGFAGGTRASAYMLLGCLLLANLMMRTRVPPKIQHAAPLADSAPAPSTVGSILRDPTYILTIIGAFFCQISIYFPVFYIQLYSVSNGVDLRVAFYSVAILNAGSVIGRILPNFFADKFGAFNIIVPCAVFCAGLMFSMLGIRNTASMSVVATLYGIASGAYLALIVALVASLAKTPAEIGLRIGVAFSTNSFAALVGIPIAGALLTSELRWERAIIFSAVCVFIGAIFFASARYAHIRRTQ